MSRSKRGKKSSGYEWWSKRPGKGQYSPDGAKFGKRQTHKAERSQGKKILREQSLAEPKAR